MAVGLLQALGLHDWLVLPHINILTNLDSGENLGLM